MAINTTLFQFENGMGLGPSPASSDVHFVNCFQVPTPEGRSKYCVSDIHGSETAHSFSPAIGTGCRGIWSSSTGPYGIPVIYAVYGNSLFRFDGAASVEVGKVVNSSRICTFAENQDQTGEVRGYVCDGFAVYEWKLKESDGSVSDSFKNIDLPYVNGSDTEKAVASYITYNTYRLIISCSNTNQWFFSDLNSGTFQNLSFETSESNPDNTVRATSFGGNIWVQSRFSFDIYSYTGSASDPFDVVSGGTGRIGCASGDSVAVCGDLMLWLGQIRDGGYRVYMAYPSGSITAASNPGIERLMRGWTSARTARAFCIQIDGLTFYVITSKNDNITLAYCIETKFWCRFADSENGALYSWDVCGAASTNDGHSFLASRTQNILATFNEKSRVDYSGRAISRYWQGPVLISNLKRFFLLDLSLDMECGTAFDVGKDAEVFLEFSWQGGNAVFGNRAIRSYGKMGEYSKQVMVLGQGSGYALVMRIGTSSNAPFVLFQIRIRTEEAA